MADPLAQIVTLIKTLNVENMTDAELIQGLNTANEIDYLRFDPLVTAALMLKVAGSKSVLKGDVLKLLALIIVRGTNFSDATIRMSDAGKSEMTALINKYGIKIDPSGTKRKSANRAVNRIALSPETVTLGRVASAFPQWAALLIASSPEGSPLRKWVPLAAGLPYYLAFPQCISLIPTDDSNLKATAREFYKRFDETINRNLDEDEKIRAQRVDMFFNIINESPLLDNIQRRRVLTSLETVYKDKDLQTTKERSGGLRETIQKNAGGFNNVVEFAAAGGHIDVIPVVRPVPGGAPASPVNNGQGPAEVKFNTEEVPETLANKGTEEKASNAFNIAVSNSTLPTGYYDVELLRTRLPGLPWKAGHANKVLYYDAVTRAGVFYAKNPIP